MGTTSSNNNQMAEEVPAGSKKWKVDASANGCSGMFWRTRPEMNATTSSGDWPRNGTVITGVEPAENPGWIKVDGDKGYWMPIQQHGKNVCHLVEE
jgi:hypothetical protein